MTLTTYLLSNGNHAAGCFYGSPFFGVKSQKGYVVYVVYVVLALKKLHAINRAITRLKFSKWLHW